jgi:hypothetical protein
MKHKNPFRSRSIKLKRLLGPLGAFAAAAAAQASGDYGPAIWNPPCNANYYTSGYGHKFHVCHDMEGYYLSSISMMKACNWTASSVHYLVNGIKDASSDAPAGELTQMIAEANYAWHARCWNKYSTGTEHEGFASNPAWYTDLMYETSTDLTRHIAGRFGFAKDRNHIVGHGEKSNANWAAYCEANFGCDAHCNSHTDPGPYWNWPHYMSLVNNILMGAIRNHYNDLGGMNCSFLGNPLNSESTTPDGVGRYNHFSGGGSIYWTPNYGAWSIHGLIRNHWESLGWENSAIGYPTTDEMTCPDGVGRYNHFSKISPPTTGSIYWTPSTGAWEVHGAIRDTWASMGWERSALGYPTSDEYSVPEGRRSNFQHGTLTWHSDTGQVTSP